MTLRHRPSIFIVACAAMVVTIACASAPPKPARTRLTVAATADTNPDANGRPSPVVVRVYQLKADTAFNAAEFFALFDDEMKVLGPDLIGRNEYTVAPSERRTLEMDVSADAKFVGIIAAYRDIRNAQWRTIVQAPLKKDDVTIAVERSRVVFSVPN
jgi:type VI secretion system protein VasD